MLKKAESRKAGDGVGGNNRAGCGRSKIDGNKVDGGEVEIDEVGKKVQKTTKFKNLSKAKKAVWLSDFLTLKTKLTFTELRQALFKALILHHFDLKRHIRIKTDASSYVIGKVLSQLISEGGWHPVAFISHKMILAETRYKTYDGKLLAIVKAFKTWRHYLEGS